VSRHGFSEGAFLKSFQQHFDDEPSSAYPVALVLCFDNDLCDVFGYHHERSERLLTSFSALLNRMGYEYELHDPCTVNIHPRTDLEAFASYFHFQWICSFLEPDMIGVSEDLFGQ